MSSFHAINSSWRRRLISLPATALALALSACGGDSDSPATLTLGADSADVAWNAPTDVDVLANDKASRGTLSLSALSAPAHGTATIADGKVRYTPASGYFGPDELTYTVTGADAATSTAKLSVAVNASLALSGTVNDGPIANAVISAAVGTKTVAATADAGGAYSVTIRTANPADMVVITATGVGTQSKVKLVSAVGDAAALAAQAGTTAKLTAAQLPALNVTHLSSSLLALVTEANGAKVPATQAQFDGMVTTISLQRALDMAAAIKLVVDHGVALPAGAADTLALIDKPSSSTLLSAFLLAQSAGDYPTAMDTARLEVQAATAAGATTSVAANAPQTLVYFIGSKLQGSSAIEIAYKQDGTARVVTDDGAEDATWKLKDGAIVVALTVPYSRQSSTEDFDPITFESYNIRVDTTGYRFKQVAGSSTSGAVLAVALGNTTNIDGPNAGTVVPFDANAGFLLKVQDITAAPSAALAFAASDFAVGAMWAGVEPQYGNFLVPQDLLSIVDATKATYVLANSPVTWSIANGALVIVDGDSETRYRRLTPEAATGEQHWLVQSYTGGVLVRVTERLAAKVSPDLAFTADPINYRRWISGISDTFIVAVYAGGTGATFSVTSAGDSAPSPTTWAIGSNGQLTQSRGTGTQRVWRVLRRQGGSIIVLERVGFQFFDDTQGWRVNIYADGGPAVPTP